MNIISIVGVIGTGIMASGISQEGFSIVMIDTGPCLLEQGMGNNYTILNEGKKRLN